MNLIKKVFIVLLSFSEYLTCDPTKCLFLNDGPCMVIPTLIAMNPFELKYYPFVISIDKCTASCNVFSPKVCVPKEITYIYVTAFDVIENKNKAKAMTEHISCDCKCKINSTSCNSNQKWSL